MGSKYPDLTDSKMDIDSIDSFGLVHYRETVLGEARTGVTLGTLFVFTPKTQSKDGERARLVFADRWYAATPIQDEAALKAVLAEVQIAKDTRIATGKILNIIATLPPGVFEQV